MQVSIISYLQVQGASLSYIYIGSHLALNEAIKILIIKGLENKKRLLTFAASKNG